ncbi:MAG: septal ring lytic transglycosylase RlpA family protein [Bacteroidetes bacterium]|nr:septal ring lytic transglycosylase RlpA family protein [Bacteroidota bacterium]
MKPCFVFVVCLLLFEPLSSIATNAQLNFICQDTALKVKPDTIDSMSVNVVTIDSTIKTKFYYGNASFYSKSLEGTKTSNDEIFSHKKLTCASNRFKLGTWLRVTNLSNNKSIIVRVNDRMHPRMDKKGRIVDLSYVGAKKLNFIEKGVTKVKVEIVPKGTKE